MSDKRAYINALAGVVPEHDVHKLFIDWAEGQVEDPRMRKLFMRMADRSRDRASLVGASAGAGRPAAQPAGRLLSRRLRRPPRRGWSCYAEEAPELALAAIAKLREQVDAGRHHPSRRGELHRLRRARHRPDHRPRARHPGRRAHPGRLHGLLCGGVGAPDRLSYRPLRARGAGAGGDGRALLASSPGDAAARAAARHAPVQRRRRRGSGHAPSPPGSR